MKVKRKEILCYLILGSLSIIGGLDYTDLGLYGKSLSIFALIEILLVMFLIYIEKFNIKEFIALVSILILSIVTYIKSDLPYFLFLIIIAITFHSIDYKKGLRTILLCRTFVLLSVISLSLVGVLDIQKRAIEKVNSTIVGYGLGFSHPNRLAFTFLYIMLVYYCYRNDNMRRRDYIVLLVLSIICNLITGSRTALFCGLCMISLSIIINNTKFRKKFIKYFNVFAMVVLPICAFFSVFVPLYYRQLSNNYTNNLAYIDVLMNGRITIASRAFRTYNITLFGGLTDYSEMYNKFGSLTVDNGYVRFLFSFGVFGFSCMLIFSVLSLLKLLKKKEYNYVVAFIVIALWGISENVLISYSLNVIAIFWRELLNYRKVKNNEKT